MNAADKVEILKSAAATLYGSGAMGGVVNVFSHLPDKLEVKAGVSGGFYERPLPATKAFTARIILPGSGTPMSALATRAVNGTTTCSTHIVMTMAIEQIYITSWTT
jgi:outer membrane receptor for Fe3+-dicitrate